MSIEAMKMAWWALCLTNNEAVPDDIEERREAAIEALRQAIEQEEKPPVKTYAGGRPNYCTQEYQYEVVAEHADGTYTTKRIPKREWVGLTDEEIYDYADKFLYQHGSNYGIRSFGKAIEAKLKEKNGG